MVILIKAMLNAKEFTRENILAGLQTRFVGRNLIFLRSTTSTMDEARRLAKEGAPEGTVVLSDEQTAGRGRFQRAWVSPKGASVLLSVVFRPTLAELPYLNMVASLAVVQAVEEVTPLKPRIKWPNDVLLEGRKACGILVDSSLGEGVVHHAVAGIGLNVNLDPYAYPEIAGIASSLSSALGRPVSRLRVLLALLDRLEELYLRLKAGESLQKEGRAYLDTLGKMVRVKRGDAVEEGYAEGISQEGHLLLRRADGSLYAAIAGEVSLRS